MKTAQVIVFPRGQLRDTDRATLRRAGVVAVEADNPRDVVIVLQGAGLVTPDDMLMSALLAANDSQSSCIAFTRQLCERLVARERAAAATKEDASPA